MDYRSCRQLVAKAPDNELKQYAAYFRSDQEWEVELVTKAGLIFITRGGERL